MNNLKRIYGVEYHETLYDGNTEYYTKILGQKYPREDDFEVVREVINIIEEIELGHKVVTIYFSNGDEEVIESGIKRLFHELKEYNERHN